MFQEFSSSQRRLFVENFTELFNHRGESQRIAGSRFFAEISRRAKENLRPTKTASAKVAGEARASQQIPFDGDAQDSRRLPLSLSPPSAENSPVFVLRLQRAPFPESAWQNQGTSIASLVISGQWAAWSTLSPPKAIKDDVFITYF